MTAGQWGDSLSVPGHAGEEVQWGHRRGDGLSDCLPDTVQHTVGPARGGGDGGNGDGGDCGGGNGVGVGSCGGVKYWSNNVCMEGITRWQWRRTGRSVKWQHKQNAIWQQTKVSQLWVGLGSQWDNRQNYN